MHDFKDLLSNQDVHFRFFLYVYQGKYHNKLSREKNLKKDFDFPTYKKSLHTIILQVLNHLHPQYLSMPLKWPKKSGQLFATTNDKTTPMLIHTDHLIAISSNILDAHLSVLLPINLLSQIFSFTIYTKDIILSVLAWVPPFMPSVGIYHIAGYMYHSSLLLITSCTSGID